MMMLAPRHATRHACMHTPMPHSTPACSRSAPAQRRQPRCNRHVATHAAGDDAASGSGREDDLLKSEGEQPWKFGFQVNERYLSWDDSAARQLIKMVLSEKLGMGADAVEEKLGELSVLVPDVVGKLEKMRVDILEPMLLDLPGLTRKLLVLREQLPGVNVSQLVARWPYIVLDFSADDITSRMRTMREQLPGVKVERLIDLEPMLLKADIPTVLGNIRRVLPKADPIAVLVQQPEMVLDMASAGMLSAADVEGCPPGS
ncbi:hypothetical protein FOA52_014119 [Chlamydomonas sp. UWO 241]|nr:hypothetical protein FOA52_014119 [Chlamydomonas sp. UWO 241]